MVPHVARSGGMAVRNGEVMRLPNNGDCCMRQEPEGFDEFWCEWRKTKRHTDGRGKCRSEYIRQLKHGATPEDILLAAQWHVRNTKDLAFIPLASTWLHSELWAEEADKERRLQASQADRATNVVSIKAAPLPENHFSRKWERLRQEG
jgi:hypothetical protein